VREFTDRVDAGDRLGETLFRRADLVGSVVIGLPRGGVVVAAEVARRLGSPLDVVVVRKLGVPGHEELAFGAVTGDGHRVLNPDVVRQARLSDADIEAVTRRELEVAAERTRRYRGTRSATPLVGRKVVVVDDGVATGATLRAAADVVLRQDPSLVIVGVPVAPRGLRDRFTDVDDVVVLRQPDEFWAVGQAYRSFGEVSDAEVAACLNQAAG
jgi:predicted phosphoribosyltransferase